MKTRWTLVVILGGMCAWGRAEIFLTENSGQYTQGDHYTVQWEDVDPNDPNNPLQPLITINYDIDNIPFWFICKDETGQPADIYGITAVPDIEYVLIKVVAKDGVSPGARNVGKLEFDYGDGVWAYFPAFNITGSLGTLGVGSSIAGIMGQFSVLELGEPFAVNHAIGAGAALLVTGAGPHYANLTVKSLWGSGDPNDVQIDISGDYLGTLTLGIPT